MDADRAGSTAPYPDWLGDARRVLGAVDLPAIDLTVGYTSTSDLARVDHHQVFRGGRLESWDLGIPDDCDLHLRQPMSTYVDMTLQRGVPTELIATSELITSQGPRPVPPLDEVLLPWGQGIPVVDATNELLVQQQIFETPFGTVPLWFRIDRGPVVAAGLGRADRNPDIFARRRYSLALLERAGEIDLLESLEGGDVIGEPRSLMMFLGGFDVPECLAARRSVATPTDDALGRFGLLVSSTAWQDATKSLSALFSEATSVP